MKKLLGLLLTTIVMAAGLVAANPAPSQAACPYTNCVQTKVLVSGQSQVRAQRRTPYRYNIRIDARGSAAPRGSVLVQLRGGGVSIRRAYGNYGGGVISVAVRFRNAGAARLNVVFNGRGIYRDSRRVKVIRVYRAR